MELLKNISADTTGEAYVSPYVHRHYHVIGTFDTTVTIEESGDGVDWEPILTTTVPGIWSIVSSARYTRATVSSYVSGTVDVILSEQ